MKPNLITLRPYQDRDVKQIETNWNSFRSILYQLPTGGGKSVVMSKLILDAAEEGPQLFLAHKRRLLIQIKQRLESLGLDVGLIIGSTEENLGADIILGSIKTVTKEKRHQVLMDTVWKRVYIDEARHSLTGSYQNFLDKLFTIHPTCRLLGVDATPYRKDGKRLDKYFQTLICSDDVQTLIDNGYLSKYRTYHTPVKDLEEEVKQQGGDYQITSLSEFMRKPELIKYAIDAYKEKGEGRQAIIFCVDKLHAKQVKQAFIDSGFTKIDYLDSDVPEEERDEVFRKYESKEIDILINIEMLTEGIDLPETGCILLIRPTKSMTLYLQMVGRGTRLKSDGGDLIVIDCAGCTGEFGSLSSPKHWSLNPDINPNNPREKNKVVAKKKDGTYSEDIEPFDELVELNPEEYIAHVKGGMESAQKKNVTIDEKIKALFDALIALFAHMARKDWVGVTYRLGEKDRGEDQVIYLIRDEDVTAYDESPSWNYVPKATIRLSKNKQLFWNFERQVDYNSNKESILSFMKLTWLVGILNQAMVDDEKTPAKIFQLLEQINDLKNSKIDLDQFKEAAKKFEEEQYQKAIENFLTLNNEIMFGDYSKSRSIDLYFGRQWGRFNKIVLKDNSLKKTMNNVKFIYVREDGKEEMKYETKFCKRGDSSNF